MPTRITAIVGHSSEPALAEKLHDLAHSGQVEYLSISAHDLSRKRMRAKTDQGTECTIALPRDVVLEHGVIVELSASRAIVIEIEELKWLGIEAKDKASALRLGFLAGHHHWRVRFVGTRMDIAMDAPESVYTDRLKEELADGRVTLVPSTDE